MLPCWRAGIEAEVNNPAIRDALWFGLYTGMRRDEVLTLRWERVDMEALTFRVEETKRSRTVGRIERGGGDGGEPVRSPPGRPSSTAGVSMLTAPGHLAFN